MPIPNNPRVARTVLTVARDTRKFQNVIHLTRSDAAVLTAADLTNMANLVSGWWSNSYRQTCNGLIVGETVVATKLDPADPQQVVVFNSAPGSGSGGDVEPGNVSASISFRSGLAGRKHRGRFYHFMPDGTFINANDSFQGTLVAAFSAVGNYLLQQAALAALNVVVFHRSTDTYTNLN